MQMDNITVLLIGIIVLLVAGLIYLFLQQKKTKEAIPTDNATKTLCLQAYERLTLLIRLGNAIRSTSSVSRS